MNRLTNWLLWLVYAALLIVLLPHTAWAFSQFEPPGWAWLGWVGAAAFEGAIAALTWRLKQRIEATPRYRAGWIAGRRLVYQVVNVYGLGLLMAVGVSTAANWAHAVEYGRPFAVFSSYEISPAAYSVAFGGILPLCSLLFARILADTRLASDEPDPELEAARAHVQALRAELKASEQERIKAVQRFEAIGDLAVLLTADQKVERIRAAQRQWPGLPDRAIAVITDASPSYVSEVRQETD